MATSTQINALTALYVGYFDRAPDPAGLQFWIDQIDGGREFNTIAADFAASAEAEALYPYLTTPAVSTPSTFVQNIYLNLFGRAAETEGLDFWTGVLEAGSVTVADFIEAIINGAVDAPTATPPTFDKAVLDNKIEVGLDFATDAGNTPGFTFDAGAKAAAVAAVNGVTEDEATVVAAKAATDAFVGGAANPGATLTLTAGIDAVTGTAANDTFQAFENATGATVLNALDSINGGLGDDTLKVVDTAAIDTTAMSGLKIESVENVEITSGSTVTANSTGWTGTTSLTGTSVGGIALTADANTKVMATDTAYDTTADGGVNVQGGSDVTVNATAKDATTDGDAAAEIVVGGVASPAGAISVTSTGKYADGSDNAMSNIAVTGGTSASVTQKVALTAAQMTAQAADATNNTVTQGAVSVTGGAATTEVSVSQDAAVAEVDSTGTDGKIGIANGAVTIADGNGATLADTITTVSLSNFGASSVTSTVLNTLNVKGGDKAATASGAITLNKSAADTSTTSTTLALNSTGGHIGKIDGTLADELTTVNVAATAATTIADIEMDKLATLNVSGEGVVTFSSLTAVQNAKLAAVNSTGAGVTIGTELAAGVAVSGGAGVENVMIGATTKTVDLGAGNDVATLSVSALGAGGSLKGGEGTDTLVMNTNGSAIAGLPQITGFETLRVAGAAAQGAHNANGFTALEVGLLGAGNASFTNVAAGVGLTQLATMGNDLTVSLADATGTSDVFNLNMKSAGAIGNAGETITLNGVETVNVSLDDTDTTAHVNVLELVGDKVTTVNVSGDAGLQVLNAPATITNFDASGVVLGKVTDTGVTFTSTNSTVAEIVNIKGSNGVDALSGSATANDVIDGGAGADTIIYTGGSDTFTGGAGNDTFDINANGTKAAHAKIMDLTAGDKIDFAGVIDAGTLGNVDYAAGAGGFGAQKVTLGAAATLDMYLDAAAAADGATGDEIVKWFDFGGDTYVVVDNTAGATFSATDSVVKLAGGSDLTNSAVVDGVLTFA
jgi:S-layer protein